MAKRKRKASGKALFGKSSQVVSTKALPKLSDIKVPKGGLMSPSLRSDLGNIPGLAPSRPKGKR